MFPIFNDVKLGERDGNIDLSEKERYLDISRETLRERERSKYGS